MKAKNLELTDKQFQKVNSKKMWKKYGVFSAAEFIRKLIDAAK